MSLTYWCHISDYINWFRTRQSNDIDIIVWSTKISCCEWVFSLFFLSWYDSGKLRGKYLLTVTNWLQIQDRYVQQIPSFNCVLIISSTKAKVENKS